MTGGVFFPPPLSTAASAAAIQRRRCRHWGVDREESKAAVELSLSRASLLNNLILTNFSPLGRRWGWGGSCS